MAFAAGHAEEQSVQRDISLGTMQQNAAHYRVNNFPLLNNHVQSVLSGQLTVRCDPRHRGIP